MKGYLTVFLAMSLSILTGFILFLTGFAIQNGEKVRLECAVDTGMNAVLSEYHIGLFERYGLLYVDASYLGQNPSIGNVEQRLQFYTEANSSQVLQGKNAPWGKLLVEEVAITNFETAAAESGASMRNQACLYVQDAGEWESVWKVLDVRGEIQSLYETDAVKNWCALMEQIAGMELPVILNEKGIWEEIPLSNPADWVYGLLDSDVLYLGEIGMLEINPTRIDKSTYISGRGSRNECFTERSQGQEEALFLSYLFQKLGCLGDVREKSLLSCQLEYLAGGANCDLENARIVADKLLRWRFADNVLLAFSDGDLRARATEAAEGLQAVALKPEFCEPVAESILYACAFLESIGDLRRIYSGGAVPARKSSHQMSVERVLSGNLYICDDSGGFTYKEYLAELLLQESLEVLSLRAMDVMEMDIRYADGNPYFAMDWCIERIEAEVSASGSWGRHYSLKRKYGYF